MFRVHFASHSGPAPRGALRGRAPKSLLVSPKRGLCPEEINRLGATGVQIEPRDSQNTAYHPKIREQELFFRRFCNERRLFLWTHPRNYETSRIFWDEDLYFILFFAFHLRIRGNSHDF